VAVVPVFPGSNGEDDASAALEASGGAAETVLIRGLRPDWLEQSAQALTAAIGMAQMLVLPGGYYNGAAFFRGPRLTEAVRDLLHRRGGLVLGIGGGFQTLLSLGLVPFGDILEDDGPFPRLSVNAIGRHQARYVHTRVSSILSPWLMRCAMGEIHTLPVSLADGRFDAADGLLQSLIQGGQIASQFCDVKGVPSMATFLNPCGSALAAESVTSPDGRVMGKTAHAERAGLYIGKNIPGNKVQPIFEGGVRYFR
jgi:phosphoribosylformylglycinamidine synthase